MEALAQLCGDSGLGQPGYTGPNSFHGSIDFIDWIGPNDFYGFNHPRSHKSHKSHKGIETRNTIKTVATYAYYTRATGLNDHQDRQKS